MCLLAYLFYLGYEDINEQSAVNYWIVMQRWILERILTGTHINGEPKLNRNAVPVVKNLTGTAFRVQSIPVFIGPDKKSMNV